MVTRCLLALPVEARRDFCRQHRARHAVQVRPPGHGMSDPYANLVHADARYWADVLRKGSPGWLLAPQKLPEILDALLEEIEVLHGAVSALKEDLAQAREEAA